MKRKTVGLGWNRFYSVIRRIPRGRVSTYGAIAEFAGHPRAARHVGYALAALRGTEIDVPWHRVLGARTRRYAAVTIHDPVGGALQRERLLMEGVQFDLGGKVSLERYGWAGPARRSGNAATGRPAAKAKSKAASKVVMTKKTASEKPARTSSPRASRSKRK